MKYSIAVSSVFVLSALAQFPPGFPACGSVCIGNMLALAPSLGCKTPDPACLCSNPDFGNGVRDCSKAACGKDSDDAETVISFGTKYCKDALAGGSGSGSGSNSTSPQNPLADKPAVPTTSGNSTISSTALGSPSASASHHPSGSVNASFSGIHSSPTAAISPSQAGGAGGSATSSSTAGGARQTAFAGLAAAAGFAAMIL